MRLGTKGKKALGYAKKGVVVAGAVGSIVGIGKKATHKVEDTKEKVEAGKVIAGGLADVGKDAVADVKANPFKAGAAVDKAKVKAGGIAAAAKIDPVGAADTIEFARNPTAPPPPRAPVDRRYGTPDEGGTGAVVERGGFQSTGGGGDIRVCDRKYQGRMNTRNRKKCKKRVKAGGMP